MAYTNRSGVLDFTGPSADRPTDDRHPRPEGPVLYLPRLHQRQSHGEAPASESGVHWGGAPDALVLDDCLSPQAPVGVLSAATAYIGPGVHQLGNGSVPDDLERRGSAGSVAEPARHSA